MYNNFIIKMFSRCTNVYYFYSELNIKSVRCYARWTHRRPTKILMPFSKETSLKQEKVIDLKPEVLAQARENHAAKLNRKPNVPNETSNLQNKTTKQVSTFPSDKSKAIKEKRQIQLQKQQSALNNKKVFDDNGNIIYEKLKDNDGRVSTLLIKLKSKKERLQSGQVLVEGWKLIVDGLEAKCTLNYIIFSCLEELNKLRPFLPKSGAKVYKIPYKEIKLWSDLETSPGILGVFRKPKSENVNRFSKVFPINIICDNVRMPGNLGAILRAAVGVGCDKVFLMKGCVDLWGPKVVRSAAGAHFRLTVHTSVEWQQISEQLDENTSVFIADNDTKTLEKISEDTDGANNYKRAYLPIIPYYGVEFGCLNSITLIIGGETEGISEEGFRFSSSRNGLRLNIPLEKGVDSLNTGMAMAVIVFEIKKQLLEARSKARAHILKSIN